MQRTDFFQENCPIARTLGLVTVVAVTFQWGDRWLMLPGASLSRMIETATGHPVAKLEVASNDGRRLGPAELGLASDLSHADPA